MNVEAFALDLLAVLVSERAELLGPRSPSWSSASAKKSITCDTEIKADRNLRTLTGDSPAMKSVRQAIGQVGADRQHRADPGRDRHRQGAGGPRASIS